MNNKQHQLLSEIESLPPWERGFVMDLITVLTKHKNMGSLKLVELFRMAWEQEIGYGYSPKKTKSYAPKKSKSRNH